MRKRSAHHHPNWGDMEQELNREKRVKFAVKKSTARREGHEWDISFDDVVWPRDCPILGIPLNYFSEGRTDSSVSITRLDDSLPYNTTNLLVCSYRASRLLRYGVNELHRGYEFKVIQNLE